MRRVRDQRAGHAGPGRAGTGVDADTSAEAAVVGMGYWPEPDLPFYYGLARTFPLADRWFSSCLGPTFPNRRFLIAGHRARPDRRFSLQPARLSARRDHLRPADRVRDLVGQLSPRGQRAARWRHYARHTVQDGPAPPSVRDQRRSRPGPRRPEGHPVHRRRLPARDRPVHGARPQSSTSSSPTPASGTLPAFSIVDPDFGAYSEENPQDIRKGESFAAEVINTGPARCRLAAHAADLGLRRARRLLRPRAAACGDPAG